MRGRDGEAKVLGYSSKYIRKLEDAISNPGMLDPLKTQILSSMDVVTFKGHSVLRMRIPRQNDGVIWKGLMLCPKCIGPKTGR